MHPRKRPILACSHHVRAIVALITGFACLLTGSGCVALQNNALRIRETRVPERAYSIFGEVSAWTVEGPKGAVGKVRIPLERLRNRIGRFDKVRVYDFDPSGNVRANHRLALAGDEAVTLRGTAGHSYLAYAELGPRIDATYRLLCKLNAKRIPRELSDRVCSQILCSGYPLRADSLPKFIPELAAHAKPDELGDELVGGFHPRQVDGGRGGMGGDPCEQCLRGGDGAFYPTDECRIGGIWPPSARCADEGQIVFDAAGIRGFHVRSILYNGGQHRDLTPESQLSILPDVHIPSQRIVFAGRLAGATSDSLIVMNIHGLDKTPIPGTSIALFPRWSKNPAESFIVFQGSHDGSSIGANVIRRVSPDGSGNQQLTFPAGKEADSFPEHGPHGLYFCRSGDLFHLAPGDAAPVNLTNTPGAHEGDVAMSHDGELLAFVEDVSAPTVKVCVARLGPNRHFDVIHRFELQPPLLAELHRMVFAWDDSCLLITSREQGQGALESDVFSVSLDGSSIERLTELGLNMLTISGNKPPPR